MTGAELRQLIRDKWGFSFDLQLRRTQGRIFLQVMWRYQEQVSFPLSEADYLQHLDQVAAYLNGWRATEQVVQFIQQTKQKPRLGKAVSIPLELGERASEWILENL